MDHGPFLVDNNLFLSGTSLLDMSEGGAYAHNLFRGKVVSRPEPGRETPYHPAHSTTVAGLATIKGGDDRFHNNIFVGPGAPGGSQPAVKDPEWTGGYGLWVYDFREYPLQVGGNVYYRGARPYAREVNPVILETDPKVDLVQAGGEFRLQFAPGAGPKRADTTLVTTALLGKAKVPAVSYENADGSPLAVAGDYFGKKRNKSKPTPGPFEKLGFGPVVLKLR